MGKVVGKVEPVRQGARRIVTYGDLVAHYPGSDLRRWVQVEVQDGLHTIPIWESRAFEPTHRLRLKQPGQSFTRVDYVWLDPSYPVSFAYFPQQDKIPEEDPQPAFALENQRWQSLWSTHQIRAEPVTFSFRELPKVTKYGYVYFIQAGDHGPIKIGWSCNVRRRLAELQTGNASRLVLLTYIPGTLQDERSWHRRFEDARIDLEWFHPVPELKAAITSM